MSASDSGIKSKLCHHKQFAVCRGGVRQLEAQGSSVPVTRKYLRMLNKYK